MTISAINTELINQFASYYFTLGGIFALAFVLLVANYLDVHARHATWGFRLMIFPAACILWPLIMPVALLRCLSLLGRDVKQMAHSNKPAKIIAQASDKKPRGRPRKAK